MTPCLADETIAAWASSALSADERERAIEHVASCERCRLLVGRVMAPGARTPARIGRYEVRGSLGAGGMGVVLRGHDPVLGRDVAIKMIKSTLVEPAHRERMLHEAQAMAKVRHPNVVTVHELGEAGDELYVAMELVAGVMLHRWLQTSRPLAARLAVVLAVGRGIAAVHAAGLLHRDIKPDNIVVREDGTPVLVDFGLARAATRPALGAGSGIAGTPRYLAPEVAAGGVATAASDQYQWWTLVEDALPDDRRVAPLVARGHDRDPARRFARMPEAVAALERALAPPARGRSIAVAGIAAVAIAGALVAFGLARDREPPQTCDVEAPRPWSLARRLELETAMRRAGVDPIRVLAALDRRVQTTIALRARGCAETARGAAERAEWTRRLVCVDEAWAKTAQTLEQLGEPDDARVREAADELAGVPPIERCGRGSLPATPMPLSPDARARYHALVKQLQQIETDAALPPPQRTAKLRALEPEIRALDHAPLDARWQWSIAHTLGDARDAREAAKHFDLSAQAGLAAGEDAIYVRALIAQLHVLSSTASAERIAQLETQAQAGVRRLDNPHVEASLLGARANLYMDRGDNAKARALYEQADALYSRIALAPMAMHVAALQNLGAIHLEAGDPETAERYLDRAVELARGRYREGAPYWEARAARASVLMMRRKLGEAELELRAAADGLARAAPAGGQAGQLGMMRAYLCLVLRGRGALAEAREACAASVAAMRSLGPESPAQVWPLVLSAQVEIQDQRPDRAVAFTERAVALAVSPAVRPIERAIADANHAIALLAVKRTTEARALARKIAPALRSPELAETRGDFVRAFPELARSASP